MYFPSSGTTTAAAATSCFSGCSSSSSRYPTPPPPITGVESRRRRRISRPTPFPTSSPAMTTTRARRRTEAARAATESQSSEPSNSRRTANLFAKRKERIKLPDYADCGGRPFPISEFLRHPSGVESILNTRALHSFQHLDSNTYRCTLQKIQFLKFEVVPVIDLRVTPTREDCTVELLSCKFEGSETLKQQNHLFSAFMRNHITWEADSSEPCLDFDVNLSVTLEVYTKPFSLLPLSAVETPGNLIMQGLLNKLVPLLVHQLLEDYRLWVEEQQMKVPL